MQRATINAYILVKSLHVLGLLVSAALSSMPLWLPRRLVLVAVLLQQPRQLLRTWLEPQQPETATEEQIHGL